jgi:hypothetical protein
LARKELLMSLTQKITAVKIAGTMLLVYLIGKATSVCLQNLTYELIDRIQNPDGVFLKIENGRAVICAKSMAEIKKLFAAAGIKKLPGTLPCPNTDNTYCYQCGKGCIVNRLSQVA